MYTLNSFQLFNQSPTSKYPSSIQTLSRHTVTKTRMDGHTSPLQVIMHLLIRLERFEVYGRIISFFTRIVGYNIFGGIANLILPSRAAPAIQSSFQIGGKQGLKQTECVTFPTVARVVLKNALYYTTRIKTSHWSCVGSPTPYPDVM